MAFKTDVMNRTFVFSPNLYVEALPTAVVTFGKGSFKATTEAT